MSMYSKQKIFCNCCGKELFVELPTMYGRDFKVCSKECNTEMIWRETLSIIGKKYRKPNDTPSKT